MTTVIIDSAAEEIKPSKSEALRKLANSNRDVVLSSLSIENKEYLTKLLNDDESTKTYIKSLDDKHVLKKIYYHLRADKLDLRGHIAGLKEKDIDAAIGNGAFTIFGLPGAAATQSKLSDQFEYEGDPSVLKSALLDWKKCWGAMSADTAMSLVRTAVQYKSKPSLLILMDESILTTELFETIEYRVAGKSYKLNEYDSQISKPIDVILKSKSVSAINAIIEHPLGSALMVGAKKESTYEVLNYLFDTYRSETLSGLLDKGLNPNISEPVTGRSFISNIAYKATEEDILSLESMVKHGLDIRVKDEMGLTPLMQGVKQGLTAFVKFLLVQPNIDLYAESRFNDTVLTLASEGPNRFEERYAEHLLSVQVAEEFYLEKLEDWKILAAHSVAAGEEPPPEPKKPEAREPVKEYPMELIGLIQDAWTAGDPTTSDKYKLVKAREADPERILAESIIADGFDFGVNF